jgi:hypothetical protein
LSATKDFLFADDLAPDPPTVAYRVTDRATRREILICPACALNPEARRDWEPYATGPSSPAGLTRAEVVRWHADRERAMPLDEIALCDCCGEELR